MQILQLVGVGAMLLWLNFKLAIYTLIPVPLVFLGTWYFWRHVYPRYYRLWDSSSKQIAALSGMLSGIRVVKAFAQEQREFERFEKSSAYLKDSRLWVENATKLTGNPWQYIKVRQALFDTLQPDQFADLLAECGCGHEVVAPGKKAGFWS